VDKVDIKAILVSVCDGHYYFYSGLTQDSSQHLMKPIGHEDLEGHLDKE
jgi:hypothetical protein